MRGLKQSELGALARETLSAALAHAVSPEELTSRLAADGWWGAGVPSEAGGQNLDVRTLTSIVDAFGEAAVPVDFIETAIFPALILTATRTAGAASSFLEQLGGGEIRLAVAWQEESDQLNAANVTAHVSQMRLNAEKRFVRGFADASHILVLAQEASGELVAAIVAASSAVATRSIQIDGSSAHDLVLTDIPVDERLVFALDEPSVARAFDICRVLVAALLLATARTALIQTRDYLHVREQFGKKIGTYQVLQHRLVDIAIKIRLAEATLEAAVVRCDDGNSSIGALSSAAKTAAVDAAIASCEAAVQLHGAIGYTEEGRVGRYLKTALRWAPWLGSPTALRRQFVNLGGASADV